MGFFNSLFGKKQPELPPADLSVLGTDVHSHFIPGIDDGAKTLEQSVELIKAMHGLGFNKIITTPHIMADGYRNTPAIILGGAEKVRAALAEANIPVVLEAAAEYYLDHALDEVVRARTALTFGGEKEYLLFELSFLNEPAYLLNTVFQMQTQGYRPVLAHPERYPFWHQDLGRLEQLKDRGVLFQLNTIALSGAYGPAVRKAAERMVEKGWYELIGSDSHGMDHILALQRTQLEPVLHQLLAKGRLLNASL